MASKSLPVAIPKTIGLEVWEYIDVPGDGGGPTKGGITLATLQAWRDPTGRRRVTAADVAALTMAEAVAIYSSRWQTVRGNDVPAGVDFCVFDMDVTSGSNSGRILQRILGFTGDDVDGWIGDETVAAIAHFRGDAGATLAQMPSGAVKLLQSRVAVPDDGIAGPATRAVMDGRTDSLLLIATLYVRQCAFYTGLHDPRFAAGWLSRAEARFAFALSLA